MSAPHARAARPRDHAESHVVPAVKPRKNTSGSQVTGNLQRRRRGVSSSFLLLEMARRLAAAPLQTVVWRLNHVRFAAWMKFLWQKGEKSCVSAPSSTTPCQKQPPVLGTSPLAVQSSASSGSISLISWQGDAKSRAGSGSAAMRLRLAPVGAGRSIGPVLGRVE